MEQTTQDEQTVKPYGRDAHIEARRKRALELRLAGYSYRQIAEFTGVAPNIAHTDVQHMMREWATQPATEVRDQEVARLDRLISAHWQKALSGNVDATHVCLKIMDRRAKLLGLDAPQKVNIVSYITEMAIRDGIDPAVAVEQAAEIVSAMGL